MDLSTGLKVNQLIWGGWVAYWIISAMFVQRTKFSESFGARLTHLLPLFLGFFLVFSPLKAPTSWELYFHQSRVLPVVGDLMTFTGLSFAIWARVHLGKYWSGVITLKEGHKLIRTGPYRFVRHPIYTGFLVGFLGSAICAGSWGAVLAFPIVTVAFVIKLKREESLLTKEFGEEYRQFIQEVPALIPCKKHPSVS